MRVIRVHTYTIYIRNFFAINLVLKVADSVVLAGLVNFTFVTPFASQQCRYFIDFCRSPRHLVIFKACTMKAIGKYSEKFCL